MESGVMAHSEDVSARRISFGLLLIAVATATVAGALSVASHGIFTLTFSLALLVGAGFAFFSERIGRGLMRLGAGALTFTTVPTAVLGVFSVRRDIVPATLFSVAGAVLVIWCDVLVFRGFLAEADQERRNS